MVPDHSKAGVPLAALSITIAGDSGHSGAMANRLGSPVMVSTLAAPRLHTQRKALRRFKMGEFAAILGFRTSQQADEERYSD